ncbi:Sorting nexin mvp1 [Coemansia sp. RSA 2598]|nr:Sorting nexin mvp1 [Coemansia sp. RSA 2598]
MSHKVILPPVYTIAYSSAKRAGGGRITRDVLQKALAYSGLPRHIIGQIVLAADTGAPEISQQDFNLALAMAALAQKNMSPTIDAVLFHKDDLPTPELDGVEALVSSSATFDAALDDGAGGRTAGGPAGFPGSSDDPWLSAMAKNPGGAPAAAMGAMTLDANVSGGGAESASSAPPAGGLHASKEHLGAGGRNSVSSGSGAETFVPQISMDAVQWKLDMEDVSIKEAAEKGGLVFKHTNYEVRTRSFSAMVVRRYNDFFWISNYLVKRYPYRMHPNIPPKGFAGK